MSKYNVECHASNCEHNNKYKQECGESGTMIIDDSGKCKSFKPYDYVGAMRKSLKHALLQSRTPVVTSCPIGDDIVYVETCVDCGRFKLWSLNNNQIEISCNKT